MFFLLFSFSFLFFFIWYGSEAHRHWMWICVVRVPLPNTPNNIYTKQSNRPFSGALCEMKGSKSCLSRNNNNNNSKSDRSSSSTRVTNKQNVYISTNCSGIQRNTEGMKAKTRAKTTTKSNIKPNWVHYVKVDGETENYG